MCGIVGFVGKKHAAPILLEGLLKLEYRGYDSAGIAVLEDNKISVSKITQRIKDLYDKTNNGKDMSCNIGIGHTRWATHGAPTEFNAHPHLNEDKKFAVVHNGIIENYISIKEQLIKDGVTFVSETDTEVIPHLINKYYNGDLLSAISRALTQLEGSFALGIICTDFPDTIVAAKKFSPLIIGVCEDANMVASDVTAVCTHTKDIIYMEDGDIALIKENEVKIYSECKQVERKISHITWDIAATEKGGFDHFMMKEIFEQPKAIAQTIAGRIKDGRVCFDGLKLNSETLKEIDNIFIVACGSAYHAGIVGKYVLEELLRKPVQVDLASEFRYRNPMVDENTLTIVISQSGETADTLAALKEASSRGSHTLAIVNVVGSSIAQAADDVLYTKAGPEIAVATTKGYSTQLCMLYLFAAWAAQSMGGVPDDELESFISSIASLPKNTQKVLSQSEKIASMANHINGQNSLFFIGRNIDYAVSLEASLKLKEISYIHSEAYAAGELKHGTISLIEEGRTVIALGCYDQLFEKLLSNIKEVKARGAYVMGCTTTGNSEMETACDSVIYVPKTHKLMVASLEVIPFQIFAYYVALDKGCDIDKPRNLAKSVTVE